jgi:SRSO17 transposase
LTRSDQRRSGEAYVRGLILGEGRKSIRRIASEIVGGQSDQSLQQFVNQSPWDPQPVRRRLAGLLAAAMQPEAWVIDEVVFAKHGRFSAGVERQYVRSEGKVCNCQLGTVVSLATTEMSAPVNWRLVLPESWDTDEKRRARAHVPARERHRPYWSYLVASLDDMTVDWGVPLAPVVTDVRRSPGVEDLLTELDSRRLDYLVQVSGSVQARCDFTPRNRVLGAPSGQANAGRLGTLSELAQLAVNAERQTVVWRDGPERRTLRSQFVTVPVRPAAGDDHVLLQNRAHRRHRRLLVEWPLSEPEPRGYWLTNITDRHTPELVKLAKLRSRIRHDLDELKRDFGLCDYEGRSFLGWHHHVTLASAAYGFHLLEQLRLSDVGELGERPA